MKKPIIICVCLIVFTVAFASIGVIKINEKQQTLNPTYDNAVIIRNKTELENALQNNVGNAFICCELTSDSPITLDNLDNEYLYVKKSQEVYTEYKDVNMTVMYNGVSHVTIPYTSTEYTWDETKNDIQTVDTYNILGVQFDSSKIKLPESTLEKTIDISDDIREKYYVTKNNIKGTIMTNISNNTISDNSFFYEKDVDSLVNELKDNGKIETFELCLASITAIILFIILIVFALKFE